MSREQSILERYLPPGSLPLVHELLQQQPLLLKIVKPRKTKFGDYRFPNGHDPRHRISLNADLNPYAFLITLLHEVAHLQAFDQNGRDIKPHGTEWQKCFRQLCRPHLEAGIFPDALAAQLKQSLQRVKASSCTDTELFRCLKRYDERPALHLEDLPEGSYFALDRHKVFKKGPRLRKRFRCLNIKNGREYMVHPLAEVVSLEKSDLYRSA